MSMPVNSFTPDMISAERRPFYDGFMDKTGKIASKFVSSNPKPTGQEAGSLINRINQVDFQLGSQLLMMSPDNLFVPIISLQRGSQSTIPDLIENDPLTKGLIIGDDLSPKDANRSSVYKSIIPDCSIVIIINKELVNEKEIEVNELPRSRAARYHEMPSNIAN